MLYTQLTRFLLPLVLTAVVQELSLQFLNGGMARMPRATETLASFGLAWGLTSFLGSTLLQARQLGLVLVDSRPAFQIVQRFVFLAGLLLAAILAGLSVDPVGTWVIEELHGLPPSLGMVAQEALLWLIPYPLLQGLALFYSGLLIRARRTDVVSYATLISIGLSITAVFVLLPVPFVQAKPIWLPLLVTYVGILGQLAILYGGYWRYAQPGPDQAGSDLSFAYVVRFFWPLALIMAIQGLSRPLINLFVSRGPNGAEALAVLTIVYALGHIAYGWVNELRNVPPTFKNQDMSKILKFTIGCGLVSFGMMVLLYWVPPLRRYILQSLIGLDAHLAQLSAVPLMIFAFFPLAVMLRAYLHGVGLLEHRTKAMAPSAPSRIGAILAALIILPLFGVEGATLGVAALYNGFLIETLVVWWGIRGRHYYRRNFVRQVPP